MSHIFPVPHPVHAFTHGRTHTRTLASTFAHGLVLLPLLLAAPAQASSTPDSTAPIHAPQTSRTAHTTDNANTPSSTTDRITASPAANTPGALPPRCTRTDLNLVILGSGGPELTDRRAGSGYLLREGNRARFLIDFGPGTSQTFERVRAQIADLHAVLFTHLHVDHTNDLPALVEASFFSTRSRDLPVYGPSGNDTVPDTATFLQRLFGEQGAWSYLSNYLTGNGDFALKPVVVDAQVHFPAGPAASLQTRTPQSAPSHSEPQAIATVNDASGDPAFPPQPRYQTTIHGYTLTAVPITHGLMPSLAWRIEKDGCAVVVSGDTSNIGRTLDPLVKEADLFVAPNAVPQDSTDAIALRLHMLPAEIGRIAARGKPRALVLSHFMQRTRLVQPQSRAVIARHYNGPVHLAHDGDVYRVADGQRLPPPSGADSDSNRPATPPASGNGTPTAVPAR